MTHRNIMGLLCSLLLIFLVGFCVADELPGYITYVQGGETTIADGLEGDMIITVRDVIPYFHIARSGSSELRSIEYLSRYKGPMDAAVVFAGDEGTRASLVEVSNLSLSDENSVLMLQITPLTFYDGEKLTSVIGTPVDIGTVKGEKVTGSRIYLEIYELPPVANGFDCLGSYEECETNCAKQYGPGSVEYGDCDIECCQCDY